VRNAEREEKSNQESRKPGWKKLNGVSGTSDMQGSEPDWRSREGSGERSSPLKKTNQERGKREKS